MGDTKLTMVAVLVGLAIITSGALFFSMYTSADEPSMTECYSYSPTFVFTGSDAADIRWDFGDGTVLDSRDVLEDGYAELLAAHGGNVWAPIHTYPDNGSVSYIDYVATQTVYNSFEGGSEDSMTFFIRMYGHPVLTVMNGSLIINSIVVPKAVDYSPRAASIPSVPILEGYTFAGYYSDVALTSVFAWTTPIGEDLTIYTKWTVAVPGDDDPIPGDDEPVSDSEDDGLLDTNMFIALGILVAGILALIGGIKFVDSGNMKVIVLVVALVLVSTGAVLLYCHFADISFLDEVKNMIGLGSEE